MPTVTSSNTGGYGDTNEGVVSGLSSIQNQVHMAIRSNPTAEGASVESVCKQIRGVPEKAIRYEGALMGLNASVNNIYSRTLVARTRLS